MIGTLAGDIRRERRDDDGDEGGSEAGEVCEGSAGDDVCAEGAGGGGGDICVEGDELTADDNPLAVGGALTAAGALTDVSILPCLRSRCLDNTAELPETNGEPLATNGEPLATTGELADGVRAVGEEDTCAAAQGIGCPEASRGAMIVRSRADGLACSRNNTGALRDEGTGGAEEGAFMPG